jgi:hypothetical protein
MISWKDIILQSQKKKILFISIFNHHIFFDSYIFFFHHNFNKNDYCCDFLKRISFTLHFKQKLIFFNFLNYLSDGKMLNENDFVDLSWQNIFNTLIYCFNIIYLQFIYFCFWIDSFLVKCFFNIMSKEILVSPWMRKIMLACLWFL